MMVSLAAIMLFANGASANGGHTAAQLERAGWGCGIAGPHGWVHCSRDNGSALVILVKVFTGDGSQFLGTELLLHRDIYNGQPCAQDGGGPWFELDLVDPGNPYYACHRFGTA